MVIGSGSSTIVEAVPLMRAGCSSAAPCVRAFCCPFLIKADAVTDDRRLYSRRTLLTELVVQPGHNGFNIQVRCPQSTEVPGESRQECLGKGAIEGRSSLQATHFVPWQGHQLLEIHQQIGQGKSSWEEVKPLGLAALPVVPQAGTPAFAFTLLDGSGNPAFQPANSVCSAR